MVRMISNFARVLLRNSPVRMTVVVAFAWAGLAAPAVAAGARQTTFASPEQAVEALYEAMSTDNIGGLLKMFGPESKPLVKSGDPVADEEVREKFESEYKEANKIVREGDDKAILVIGEDEWPFPIPIVKQHDVWRFDTKAGKEEILNRRIGNNELSAIEVCGAYVDAQREYATKDRNNDGFIEYATKFLSSPGKHDGLYWPVNEGEEESPLGPLVGSAQAAGYGGKHAEGKRVPYHGYYYKILTRQGENAPGGAYDYIVNGHMIGGFALVAFPAQYGASGIMTFIVSHADVVYQKDLGPNTAKIASQMKVFDPDSSWTKP